MTTDGFERFELDPSYRRPRGGSVVIAGSPLRLFRLTAAGVRCVEAIEANRELPPGHQRLTDRLVDAGAIHPVLSPPPLDPSLVTVVLPAYGNAPIFRPRRCRTVLVDDASPTAVEWPAGDSSLGVAGAGDHQEHRSIRLGSNQGPAVARNVGLRHVTTPFVAFVDSDVAVTEDDLLALAATLDAGRSALVAPRVVATDPVPDRGALQRYESARSPLDLGPIRARIAPTTRVGYVPAATIVCRTDAVRGIGGFDESLRFGEDVDLVWRLHDAGHRCRYEPSWTVGHLPRANARSWLAQRFRYGTSAAPLAQRHPGAVAPVRMSGWSAATWAAVAVGHPVAGASIGAATTVALVRKLRDVPSAESLRLAGLGHLYAGRQLAATLVRVWWPVALVAAALSRRARRALVAAVVVTAFDRSARPPGMDALRATGLRLLDDGAYGAGVWAGAWRERTLAPLLPVLSSWPGRSGDGTPPG